jgi:hypothetical protein
MLQVQQAVQKRLSFFHHEKVELVQHHHQAAPHRDGKSNKQGVVKKKGLRRLSFLSSLEK